MKKAEIVFAVVIFLGFTLKIMHWPYGAEIITLGSIFLSMLYFGFSFALLSNLRLRVAFNAESYKGISKLRLFGAIGTGVVFSILIVYSLFKLQFWPYGQVGLGQSLMLFGIISGMVLVFHFMNRKQFLRHNYIRFIIIGSLSLFIYSVSNEQLVDVYYGSNPKFSEEYKAYIKDNSSNVKRPSRAFESN